MTDQKLMLSDQPHRRLNILTGEWILVSPHRAKRPWQGKVEQLPQAELPSYDPGCYLCPGNERAGGIHNPKYASTFVFTNDFSALLPETLPASLNTRDLLQAEGESGRCRVICFSPRHDVTLPEMSAGEIRGVVDLWTEEYRGFAADPAISYVQIFENKGALMGCSNPHPHCQIWAQRSIPTEPAKESARFAVYHGTHRKCMLCEYLAIELEQGERIVCENESFAALVPFWAVWPFELLVLPKRHRNSLLELTEEERNQYAAILKSVTAKYDNLFEISFPYSAGIHQAPVDGGSYPEWHMHMHFYPPLLRSAMVKKFMVGYEMLASPQRDITAELSAERLRGLSDIHYKTK